VPLDELLRSADVVSVYPYYGYEGDEDSGVPKLVGYPYRAG
jgi:hypothetical protein